MPLFRPVVLPPRSRAPRGRGSISNPRNRFERRHLVPEDAVEPVPPRGRPPEGGRVAPGPASGGAPGDGDAFEEAWPGCGDGAGVATRYLRDPARTIVARNESPDVGFDASANPYRGCEHGCVYCYARPTHEYLGYSAGLDFETRILVKSDAPALLRSALLARSWKPRPIAMSGVTDPYQPIERSLRLTRGCLEVLREFRNPVGIVTKSQLVVRDADVLADLARMQCACVWISITSLRARVARAMEPRASGPAQRLHAIHRLADAGVPVGVMVAPIVPGLTDEEVPAILQAAAQAGARHAGHVLLRLPHGVRELFESWLEREFPDRKGKVLSRLRSLRGGELNDPRFHTRMRGEGPYAQHLDDLFRIGLRKSGLEPGGPELSSAGFVRPGAGQLTLF